MLNNRVIFSDNGTLSDLSTELQDFTTGTSVIGVVAAQDYLYLGSDFPFNNRYLDLSVVNDQAATVSEVAYWDGSQWRPCVEVVDETAVSGVTLAQSGVLSWVPDRQYVWQRSDTDSNTQLITGLSGITIYDLYWVRITFSANLKATTALRHVGHRFSNDEHLALEYPDLLRTEVLTNFEAGKTDWREQHILAAEKIVDDLRSKNVILSPGQILTHQQFRHAAVHRVAMVVFNAFGKAFEDNYKKAMGDYGRALKEASYNIDVNADGQLSVGERTITQGYMTR